MISPLIITLTTLAAQALHAQDEPAIAHNLFELLWQGGWTMWPLAACSIAGIFLTIHCYLLTRRGRFLPKLFSSTNKATASATLLDRGHMVAMEKYQRSHDKARAEVALADALDAEESRVAQWITYLNVTATIAPMIGLLGTVSGMIGAFQKIGRGAMGESEKLAGHISEALITTATGLAIGIPAMVFYYIMRGRLEARMIATTQAANELLDRLDEQKD